MISSANFVGSVVVFLDVLSYTSVEPTPCRLDMIFDLEAEYKRYVIAGLEVRRMPDYPAIYICSSFEFLYYLLTNWELNFFMRDVSLRFSKVINV